MSSMTMEHSEISCSPALTDADLSEGTINSHNREKNMCKYPEHSHMRSMIHGMQPVLSGGSNSDKSITYTGPFPDEDISGLHFSPKTTHPGEIVCVSDRVQDFKEPLENKFTIKPITFYNSLTEMSTNSDDCEMNKSLDSMETLTQITNLKNSLNDTDTCTSTTKMKSSGFWRKRSCMVNSYMFEAALDETSFDNTINKSCSKFTIRRKKRLQANDNNFSEAFNSQTMSECSKNNESMEDTIKERALGNTAQNSVIEHNVKTRGFKIHKQSKHSERRFSEAFNNTEITEHHISQDIDNKIIKLSERSQTEESLQDCGNFCRAIRNNKQMVTSSIFQDVFNETDSSNAIVPKNIVMNNDLSNFLPTVCSGQKTQINEHLETGDNNILHTKKITEEMFSSVHTTNTQNEVIECSKSFDHSDRRDLASQSQTNFERECCISIPGETNLEENIISEVEENECNNEYCRLNENGEYNKAPHITLNVSAAKRESEPFKKTDSLLLDSNEDNEICAKKLNAEMAQNKSVMVIHGNTRASLQNESCDKENKQNKVVKSVENFSKTDRILDISGDMQETSCSALQNIVCEKNDDIYKTFHKNYSEHVMNTLKTKQNDQTRLDNSSHFKILDTFKNTLNQNTTNLATEPKHSLNKDSFCLKIQEEHSALANKICVHVSPDEGTHFKSATGDVHVIKKLICNKTKQNSNLDESNNEVASHPHSEGRKQNVEDDRIFADKNAESLKDTQPNSENIFMHSHTDHVSNTLTNIENRECLTVSDNNSLVYFQSLVYEESEGKSHEEINNGTSALLEFHASRNLKFCSSTRSSVYSADRNLSKQNTDLSEAHPDFTRTQITGESGTVLNSSSNSLISTADKDKSENSAEDIYESIEMCALNNSLDTTLTENGDSICDVAHRTQDLSSLDISQNILCIKSSELQGSKNNVTEQRFSKLSNEDTINKSKECQRNKENPSPAVQGCVSKPFLQESSSLQTQVGKHQSQTFITSTKTNNSVLTSVNSQKKLKQSENQKNNNKSKKLSHQSKEIKNILSSINIEPSKNSNQSSWGSMASCQSTNIKNSEPDVSEDIMPLEILSENDSNTQNFVITSVNTSLSDCSHKTLLHSKVSNTSKSQVSRKKLKKHSENNQKQAGSTVKNTFSKTIGRSRNNFNKSINHSGKKILKQTGKLDDVTVSTNSNKNLDVTENSTTNVEINKTLQHDESNDDNGYDVGYNTFASTNMDYTPCNDTVTNKRNHKKKLNALRKCLFNSSILQNENDVRKFSIPLSELHNRRNEKLLNEENKFEADNSFIDNKFSDGPNVIRNKSYTQFLTYGNWATKTTKDYLISKLKPRYGVKATWRCQKLVVFMAKKINETIRSKRNYNVPVGEIKLELARLNIIETNLDFYMFVLKHLRQYEPDFVFKSVPCIQTFGRPNLVPRPSNSYLKEKIL